MCHLTWEAAAESWNLRNNYEEYVSLMLEPE